jgi:hypothetical protein
MGFGTPRNRVLFIHLAARTIGPHLLVGYNKFMKQVEHIPTPFFEN